MAAVGRPTTFDEEYIKQVFKLAKSGMKIKEIADFFEVHVDTLYEWGEVHPAFSEAIKNGRDIFDTQEVETCFRKRAMGFKRTVERVTKDGEVIQVEEEVPPDTVAGIFWLKNRNPARWRDRQEIEHSGIEIILGVKEKTD